ncbi:MAG: type I-A CRISPR-associated protein Cas5a [Nitrososphaerota archaeon]
MPLSLMATLRSHGVIALRVSPQSKMRISFKHPPPTSIIGALAYPLFRDSRIEIVASGDDGVKSTADELRRMLISVAVSSRGGLMYGPLFKINRLYHGVAESAVTSLPITVTYSEYDSPIKVVYVFDDEKLTNYTVAELERAAWGITRLGSRESIVNVEDVKTSRVEISEMETVKTSFSYSLERVENVKGRHDVEMVVDWRISEIGDYSRVGRIRVAYPLEDNIVEGKLKVAFVDGEAVII